MVENLLSVTRIDDTNAGVNKTPEIVDEVISAAVAQFKKRFPGTEIIVKVPDEPVMADMDALLIQQVLINILHNARVHSQSVKPIELVVKQVGGEVEFSVRDYGVGIPEDRLETIFDGEGLYGESVSPDGHKGMGIGLSICKTIIRAHGGHIEAKNHDDGAEIVFCLPVDTEEIEDEPEDIYIGD